jgi:uncharacterized membrane protein
MPPSIARARGRAGSPRAGDPRSPARRDAARHEQPRGHRLPDVETADTVAEELHQLTKEGSIELDDMVVVERDGEGKIKLHQTRSTTGKGAAGGAVLGHDDRVHLLRAAAGRGDRGGHGSAVGKQKDVGVEDDFMDRLGVKLHNNSGAVVVLVRRSTPDKVLPRITQFGGEVIQTGLGPEREAELQEALAGQAAQSDLRQAIAAHLGSRQVARVIYGAIIGLALLVVLEQHPPGTAWSSRRWSRPASRSASPSSTARSWAPRRGPTTGSSAATLAEFADDAVAVTFGVCFPRCSSCSRRSTRISTDTAFTIARWSGLGLIGFYGYAAGRLAGARPLACVVQALAVATIGGVLIAIKALIH